MMIALPIFEFHQSARGTQVNAMEGEAMTARYVNRRGKLVGVLFSEEISILQKVYSV